ncbi:hypothetical protein XAC2852_710026 [Xanthomonas citri pv. citri]|nr:hypothetical protein XAC2852_710026 [Xanthomonas citri pv. citri]
MSKGRRAAPFAFSRGIEPVDAANKNAGMLPAFLFYRCGGLAALINRSTLPLTQRGQAVFLRALVDDLLRLGEVAGHVLGPQLQRGLLHGAAVGEAQRPGQIAELVHFVEVGGGLLVGLAAGQEHDARQDRRHGGLQAHHGGFGHLFDTGLLFAALAGDHHRGLQDGALEHDVLLIQRTEQRAQRGFGHFVAGFDVVAAVHDHFRLDHRHQALFLAQRSVTRQRMRVGLDAGAGRNVFADIDDRTPLGEARTQRVVLLQTRTQAVQAFGHQLARHAGQRLRALVDLDARDDAVGGHVLGERHAILGLLTDGLVEQDGAGDVVAQLGRGQQQFAIGATVLFDVLDADAGKTLGDRAGRFVDGDDALTRGDHRLGGFGKLFDAHVVPVAAAGENESIATKVVHIPSRNACNRLHVRA